VSSDDRESWFRALYARHYQAVVAYLKRLGFDHEAARDLAQDCFLRVCRGKVIVHPEAERAYMMVAARNAAMNERRRRYTQMRNVPEIPFEDLQTLEDGDPYAWVDPKAPSPEHALIEEEERARIRALLASAIRELPESLRQPLLFRLGGLKYLEVAATMGISIDAVKARLRDARRQLRQRLGAPAQDLAWPAALAEDHDEDP
jgi:RNA polymerase sigma-70 factor, ECF subfamily